MRRHYVVGFDEVGASAEDTPTEMKELFSDIYSNIGEIRQKPENVLAAGAFFHAKFENIHPFADGNGRTGRLAMNYFLVSLGHPPVIIHEEDRKQYYYDRLSFHGCKGTTKK